MEEKKTLKIKKPYVIIITLAIVFAILGFMDLNVWAMENYDVNVLLYDYSYDSLGNETVTLSNEKTITFNSKVDLYYYTTSDVKFTGDCKTSLFAVGSQPFSNYDISVQVENELKYVSFNLYPSASYCNNGFSKFEFTGNYNKIYKLNNDYDQNGFANALRNGALDCEEIIDYSQLQTDDTIGTIEKPLMNIIVNEVMENDLLGNATQKIYEVYNYVVWKNTENLDLQVEIAPFVNVNKGLFDKTFWKQITGEWESFEIFPGGTTTMTQRSDMYYLEETNSKYIEFLNNVENEYGGLNKECELFFAYRFRYIDISTMRAGKWVYVVPSSNGYTSFTEYLDGTKSSYEKIDGVSVETENVEDVNNIKDNIDLENEFLEKYETTEIDVEDATNWLQSVASFIKGTPDFVGSVMSFLPEPVRYGMFVCLFLGVIASGYAIVKALI